MSTSPDTPPARSMPAGAYGNRVQVDPEITASFRVNGPGFVSRNGGPFVDCPPYVIASAAIKVLDTLELPEGCCKQVLENIMSVTGFVDRDVQVTARQAHELARIGRQLLALTGEQALTWYKRQSVIHLLRVTGETQS